MANVNFIHLKTHSEYSVIDGTASIKKLFKKAAELSMPALAITDVMNLFAAVKIYKTALATGIKPIFGSDL